MAVATTYTIDEQLTGDMDAEAVARQTPPSYRVKGMYFLRLREKVGHHWNEVEPSLEQPPAGGRYLAFKDYPQADYTRLSATAAVKTYPRLPPREALRRVARDDIRVFADSTLGKVVLSVVGDAKKALLTMAGVYKKMASGEWTIRSAELSARQVRIEFVGLYGMWEYQLGQIEGVATHYGAGCRVTVDEVARHHVRFDTELL